MRSSVNIPNIARKLHLCFSLSALSSPLQLIDWFNPGWPYSLFSFFGFLNLRLIKTTCKGSTCEKQSPPIPYIQSGPGGDKKITLLDTGLQKCYSETSDLYPPMHDRKLGFLQEYQVNLDWRWVREKKVYKMLASTKWTGERD